MQPPEKGSGHGRGRAHPCAPDPRDARRPTAARIAERAGMPRTKAYRVLRDLQEHGYVDHIGRSGYRVGGRAVALASLVGPRPALLHQARPVLIRLAANASETRVCSSAAEPTVSSCSAPPPGTAVRPIVHVGERHSCTVSMGRACDL
ncbi:helix-turn-helix domain-containing protein [Kribbella sp. VKM Ac-2500]|nr:MULTISPECIES: helix-turn-helix domain-containing protein [Kribbella]